MDPAFFVRRNTAIAAPPLVPEIREKMQSPEFMANYEALINRSAKAREKAATFEKRIQFIRERMLKAKAQAK